jgi:sporulation protein YlmC with PRC-barrel domain
MRDMLLVRDVLDKQLVDRRGERAGKVDGVVLIFSPDGPPRVGYLEVGAVTLARRLGRRLGSWASRLAHRWGGAHTESYRIPWNLVRAITLEVSVDVDVEETRINVIEDWLRVHVVEHLPGGRE